MSWDDVSSVAIDIKKSVEKAYEGTYTGKKEISTKLGPQVVWQFDGEEGAFSIYGFTNLNRGMETIKEGTLVKIQYQGTLNVPTRYGQKDVHQVSVQRWIEEKGKEGVDDVFP